MEMLAQFISLLYYTHWSIFTPICMLLFHFVMGETFRKYFLSSVTDGMCLIQRFEFSMVSFSDFESALS